jgi:hypothetical protein
MAASAIREKIRPLFMFIVLLDSPDSWSEAKFNGAFTTWGVVGRAQILLFGRKSNYLMDAIAT